MDRTSFGTFQSDCMCTVCQCPKEKNALLYEVGREFLEEIEEDVMKSRTWLEFIKYLFCCL